MGRSGEGCFNYFNEWACTVERLVENRIKTLKGRCQNTQKKQTLKDPAGKQTLDKLHEDYVLAPADKAGSLSYKQILTKELTSNSRASTYLHCNETIDQINVDFTRHNNIKIPEDFVSGCLSYIRTLTVIGL